MHTNIYPNNLLPSHVGKYTSTMVRIWVTACSRKFMKVLVFQPQLVPAPSLRGVFHLPYPLLQLEWHVGQIVQGRSRRLGAQISMAGVSLSGAHDFIFLGGGWWLKASLRLYSSRFYNNQTGTPFFLTVSCGRVICRFGMQCDIHIPIIISRTPTNSFLTDWPTKSYLTDWQSNM